MSLSDIIQKGKLVLLSLVLFEKDDTLVYQIKNVMESNK